MAKIAAIYDTITNSSDRYFILDFSHIRNIDANMCACLGGIIEQLRYEGKNIDCHYAESGRATFTLRKNGFFNVYCDKSLLDDRFETVIEYRHFKNDIVSSFAEYAGSYFHTNTNGFQSISSRLLKEFRRSLNEVAGNTYNHAESTCGFITCGQFFPREHIIRFTMVDTGIGFSAHIKKNTNIQLRDHDAIKWALTGNNTGRPISEGTSGGLGLKQIKNFIIKNSGEMHIISRNGFYMLSHSKEQFYSFYPLFPGTVVSLCINTQKDMS